MYDLAMNAKDRLPLEAIIAADNTGTKDTGLYRTGISASWCNTLWRGDDKLRLSWGVPLVRYGRTGPLRGPHLVVTSHSNSVC